jgi:hypothetical protein
MEFVIVAAALTGYFTAHLEAAFNRKPVRKRKLRIRQTTVLTTPVKRRSADPNLSAWSIKAQAAARRCGGGYEKR